MCTRTEYAQDIGAYLIAMPSQVTTRAGAGWPNWDSVGAGSRLLRRAGHPRRFPHPRNGHQTQALVSTGPDVWASTEAGYDLYGRITSAKDARGQTTTYGYTPATVLAPTAASAARVMSTAMA